MAKQILSVGDLVLDLIFPITLPIEANKHQDINERWVEPGGAGNFIIAASNLGLEVSAAGAVGDDVFGKQIISTLKRFGVNTNNIVAMPNSSTTLVLAMTDQGTGQHTFVGSYGIGDVIPYPKQLDDSIKNLDAVFVQGYSMAEERMINMTKDAILQAKAFSIPVYLDVGPQMAKVAEEDVDWLIFHSDIIFVTADEIHLVAKTDDIDAGVEKLLAEDTTLVVVKQGSSGCSVYNKGGKIEVPGYQANVIDTVGAGDCFDAAFLAAHINRYSLEDCAKFANAMGAAVVQRVGAGTNAPTLEDIHNILQANGVDLTFRIRP